MYGYIKGKVVEIDSNYIIVDNNDIGYLIYVPNPYSYKLNSDYTIFIYTCVREEEFTLYGFKERDQKELFLKLINVKGLGPKMAMPIIATGTIDSIAEAIENENINYLKKFPKIGDKVAKQMILDLKGKLNTINTGLFAKEDLTEELTEVLIGLGYKQGDIKKVISKVDTSNSLEDQVKEALKLMLK
ncbi:MAG: Holliday junction branch migration protein RuvA [Bacilli bacterium]|nr:Holliday junction branch migration protein RuvA [Bacilli bacterium]